MTEIPFEWLMADTILLICGLFTPIWVGFLVELTNWKYEVTLKNTLILFSGTFVPLAIGATYVHFGMGIPCIPFLS